MKTKWTRAWMLVAALWMAVCLTSCAYVLVQQNVAKGKFKKKYNCKYKNIELNEENLESQKDSFILMGCGVTAHYEGTEEIMTDYEGPEDAGPEPDPEP
jgi:hypothetical protein